MGEAGPAGTQVQDAWTQGYPSRDTGEKDGMFRCWLHVHKHRGVLGNASQAVFTLVRPHLNLPGGGSQGPFSCF